MAFLYLRIPGTCIRISVIAVLTVMFIFYADFSVFTALIFLAAAVHEGGHLLALRRMGAAVYGITVLPFGAVIRSDAAKLSYKKEAVCALAGVFANLALALIAGGSHLLFRDKYTLFFAFCNTLLAATNLMPIKSLDGARALEACLHAILTPEKADSVAHNISVLSLAILTLLALFVIAVTDCNFSLMILCVALFMGIGSAV